MSGWFMLLAMRSCKMLLETDTPAETAMGLWSQPIANKKVAATDPPAIDEIPLRANAMRVLVTDTLFPDSPERLVGTLASRNGCGVILAPFTAAEADPDWQGNYEFVEVEDRSHHVRRVEPALLKRYRAAYQNHMAQWKSSCTRHAVAFARVAAEPPLEKALEAEGIAQRAVEPAV